MFKNKLKALEHPTPDTIDPESKYIRFYFNVFLVIAFFNLDATHFASTVLWLEDQKIRLYKIEDREGLRQIGKPEWQNAYAKFKIDVGMPTLNSPIDELSWLMIHAVKLEYLDHGKAQLKHEIY